MAPTFFNALPSLSSLHEEYLFPAGATMMKLLWGVIALLLLRLFTKHAKIVIKAMLVSLQVVLHSSIPKQPFYH
ncbi:unnamed protein product [Clonostachys rosea]|uniref:Uncharacterized protein n=1 Tax=Bionectria ochroleuca TaxID=29856 RepID=A0ABY6TZP5_BIOOC|nr:unnamed protein product [Clonostachys rosea]